MKNLKLFLLIISSLVLSFATAQPYTRAQVKTLWEPRVFPSAINIDSTFNAIVFKQDTTTSLNKVKTNSSDNTANYLSSKLAAGTGISLVVSGSTNKIITVTNTSPATYPIYFAQINIDSVALKAANGTTGIIATLVANPGASSFIDVISVDFQYTYIAPAYNGTPNFGIYPSTLTPDVSGSASRVSTSHNVLAGTASRFIAPPPGGGTNTTSCIATNSSIVLAFTTPGSKPTLGGGSLTVYVAYRIVIQS